MPTLQYPDDPTEYMEALGPILIDGTTIGSASWFVEQGVDSLAAQWPVAILTCPTTEQTLLTIQAGYQATFTVMVAYLDRWESSTRTFEQLQADAKAALFRMARNVRKTPDLGFTGIVQANNQIIVRVPSKTMDLGLGFPLISGSLQIMVKGPWFLPD